MAARALDVRHKHPLTQPILTTQHITIKMKIIPSIIYFAFLFEASLQAATVVAVTGPTAGGYTLSSGQTLGISWIQTSSYINVSVAAEVGAFSGAGIGNAYLTTQVGSGTTISSQIATASFSFPGSTFPALTLFTGLSLAPGTYFLTISAPASTVGVWAGTGTPTVSTDSGVTRFSSYFSSSPNIYAPASTFSSDANSNLKYIITGTAVPEPSSFALAAAGILLAIRNRRSSMQGK